MNNDIMKFLNIEDKDIIISKILIDGNIGDIIYLEKTSKSNIALPVLLECIQKENILENKSSHPTRWLSIKTYCNSKKNGDVLILNVIFTSMISLIY